MKDLQFEFAMRGDLEGWVERNKTAYLQALKDSVVDEAHDFQARLRAEVEAAGLGSGLANAWRVEVFPKGNKLAYEPSAFFWSNAPQIIDNFTRGEPYGPRNAQYLAIPIPGSPADALRVRPGQKRTALAEARWGPLKAIHTKGGGLMLVGWGRGGGTLGVRPLSRVRSKATGAVFSPLRQPLAMIPLFWLVKSARLNVRLHWRTMVEQEKPLFAGRVMARLQDRINAAQRRTE